MTKETTEILQGKTDSTRQASHVEPKTLRALQQERPQIYKL